MKFIKAATLILIISVALGLRVKAQSQFTNGLLAYYQCNSAGNASLNDSSGNGNNGLITGTDWQYSADRFGNPESSLFLNSADPANTNIGTYFAVPRSAALDFNQDFTLSLWVNIPNGLPPHHVHNLISDGLDSDSANFRVISAADTNGSDYLQFIGNHADADIHAFLAPIRDTWWQAIAVRSGTNVSLYQNGILVTNSPINATLVNLSEIWVGSYPLSTNETQSLGQYPLDGGIDDIRMYNRALSASEVQQLYAYESAPWVSLVRAIKPTCNNLYVGTNYQLQVSSDLNSWTNQGAVFTATNSSFVYPQYFDVPNWNQLFFRLQVAP